MTKVDDPAKTTHLKAQKSVLDYLKAPPGLTLHEAHERLVKAGLMTKNCPTPTSWNEVCEKIPGHLVPKMIAASHHQDASRNQEAAIA